MKRAAAEGKYVTEATRKAANKRVIAKWNRLRQVCGFVALASLGVSDPKGFLSQLVATLVTSWKQCETVMKAFDTVTSVAGDFIFDEDAEMDLQTEAGRGNKSISSTLEELQRAVDELTDEDVVPIQKPTDYVCQMDRGANSDDEEAAAAFFDREAVGAVYGEFDVLAAEPAQAEAAPARPPSPRRRRRVVNRVYRYTVAFITGCVSGVCVGVVTFFALSLVAAILSGAAAAIAASAFMYRCGEWCKRTWRRAFLYVKGEYRWLKARLNAFWHRSCARVRHRCILLRLKWHDAVDDVNWRLRLMQGGGAILAIAFGYALFTYLNKKPHREEMTPASFLRHAKSLRGDAYTVSSDGQIGSIIERDVAFVVNDRTWSGVTKIPGVNLTETPTKTCAVRAVDEDGSVRWFYLDVSAIAMFFEGTPTDEFHTEGGQKKRKVRHVMKVRPRKTRRPKGWIDYDPVTGKKLNEDGTIDYNYETKREREEREARELEDMYEAPDDPAEDPNDPKEDERTAEEEEKAAYRSKSKHFMYDSRLSLEHERPMRAIVQTPITHRLRAVDKVSPDAAKQHETDSYANCCPLFGLLLLPIHLIAGCKAIFVMDHTGKEHPITGKFRKCLGIADQACVPFPASMRQKCMTNRKYRYPKEGEIASIWWTEKTGTQVHSTGAIQGTEYLGVDRIEVVNIDCSSVRGTCGGVVIAESDGAILGFHGIGLRSAVGFPKFYPCTDEWREGMQKNASSGPVIDPAAIPNYVAEYERKLNSKPYFAEMEEHTSVAEMEEKYSAPAPVVVSPPIPAVASPKEVAKPEPKLDPALATRLNLAITSARVAAAETHNKYSAMVAARKELRALQDKLDAGESTAEDIEAVKAKCPTEEEFASAKQNMLVAKDKAEKARIALHDAKVLQQGEQINSSGGKA